MKSKYLLTFFFLFCCTLLVAQTPKVPKTIQFADMTLHLNDQAQREIQLDVDALHRNQNYLRTKLERIDLYMPVIERVLREHQVPQDLKYLVIQESGLIADAVSTSNAVGFWQFKKGTAEEVFLQVDRQIDERKNIVSSTRGAAMYLKKHNRYFDNWLCAVVSYQMGLGGAKGYFGDQYNGNRTMKITKNTHWYFKKFLAHKIAFENHIGKSNNGQYLKEHSIQGPTTFTRLAKDLGVTENHLKDYNKWAPQGKIPEGKAFTLTYLAEGVPPAHPETDYYADDMATIPPTSITHNQAGFPKITGNQSLAHRPKQIKINGIQGVIAHTTTTQETYTENIQVKERRFRRINDLKKSDRIVRGQYYYTKRKKGKAQVAEHVVSKGETLWGISQAYGIKLHSLMAKNRVYKDKNLQEGMILKLQEYRRRNEPIQFRRSQQRPSAPTHQAVSTNNTVSSQKNQSPKTHIVAPGETLYGISKKYGVAVSLLQEWNGLGNQTVIKVGQKLLIQEN